MALQLSVAVRNARLDVIESTIGAAPILRVFTGAMPATTATASSGTQVASMTLPSDWMGNAANGVKQQSGTWSEPAADATGTAGYFRIFDSSGSTCHLQGTVTATGGGGDMTVDNTSFAVNQAFNITSFTLTEANA